jgi:hypothetical protein
MNTPLAEVPIEARQLYEQIVRVANHFLHSCKHFSIEMLQSENPTFEEVGQVISQTIGIIKLVSDDFDPMLGQQAQEYCELMVKMGVAIRKGDNVALANLVHELGRKPGCI